MAELISLAEWRGRKIGATAAPAKTGEAQIRVILGPFNDASIQSVSLALTAGNHTVEELETAVNLTQGAAVIRYKGDSRVAVEVIRPATFAERFPGLQAGP